MPLYILQGILWGLIPLLSPLGNGGLLHVVALVMAALMLGVGAWLLPEHQQFGRFLCLGAALPLAIPLAERLYANPLLALLCGLIIIGVAELLWTHDTTRCSDAEVHRQRLTGASYLALALTVFTPLLPEPEGFAHLTYLLSGALLLVLAPPCLRSSHRGWRTIFPWAISAALGYLLLRNWQQQHQALSLFGLALCAFIFGRHRSRPLGVSWLNALLWHPARCLALTFVALPAFGTLLLSLDASWRLDASLLDTAFTAVSAACVTGLTTLDIGATFTLTGQAFLLLLIQLGGLGIISLATLFLNALGRLTLSQERLAQQLSPDEERNLLQSLRSVLFFCFTTELLGALWLAAAFWLSGKPPLTALWFGLFTSVSAFCNAGFFPEATSLEAYVEHPLILHGVALLIIAGGLAPTCAFAISKRKHAKNRPQSPAATVALTSSLLLLFLGAILLAALEWNGIFSGLTWSQTLTHAWFLSASARTAGFSSVPLASIGGMAHGVMLILMFIGGSPGGTAGGVKTTTIAVLFFAFKSALQGRSDIIVCNRRLPAVHLLQAIAICMAALASLFVVTLALAVTQTAPFQTLLFEATSALATVGLTIGATPELDEIGKVIIMLAMYVGRVGPLTFLLLLGEQRPAGQEPGLPDTHLPLG